MHKVVSLLISSLALAIIILGAESINNQTTNQDDNNLYIYNWGDYIDPTLIEKFEDESGYNVIYETYDSNESMYVKIKSGSSPYDVIFPSEYMIDKMKSESLLMELDKQKIPNITNIDPYFLNQKFDFGNKYSLPYFWGTVGIAYNPNIYEQLGIEKPTQYKDLWNPALVGNVLLLDGAREVVGSSLNSLGYSLNSSNDNELEQAKQNLLNLAPNIKGVVGDEIKMLMANNEAAAAIVWAGDAKVIQSNNPNIKFITPSEGSNIYLDNIAIPKTSKNVEGAYEFINFLLDNQNASINTEYVGYSSPIKSEMVKHKDDVVYYPQVETMNKLEFYTNLEPRYLKRYNNIFLEFKMSF